MASAGRELSAVDSAAEMHAFLSFTMTRERTRLQLKSAGRHAALQFFEPVLHERDLGDGPWCARLDDEESTVRGDSVISKLSLRDHLRRSDGTDAGWKGTLITLRRLSVR